MRELSDSLLSAQKGYGVTGGAYDAIWKIVLSRAGQTTKGYDINRVIQIRYTEEEDNIIAEVLLDNSDAVLTGIDFEQYQCVYSRGYNTGVARSAWAANTVYAVDAIVVPTTVNGYQYRCTVAGTSHATTEPTWGTALGVTQTDGTVTWEMDGNTGDEYVPRSPMKVDGQEFISSETQLQCRLYLLGLPNQMKQDKAESAYDQLDTDTNTVKDLLDAIAGATLTPYTNYSAVTLTYDTGYDDGIIDSYAPKDYFFVPINENRDDKIQELLNYTKCKRRAEPDGAIHILLPTTSGTTYDYEYRLEVSGYHTFFEKNLRNRFVNPNKEVVRTPPTYDVQYTGSATSATSYALSPKIHTTYRRLASDVQAAAIAAAIVERYELDAERGSAVVPMNCGQEIFDYIKVTDSSEGTTRTGNVQYIQENCKVAGDRDDGYYNMTIRFGRLNSQIIATENFLSAQGASIPQSVIDYLYDLSDRIITLQNAYLSLIDRINGGVNLTEHTALEYIFFEGEDALSTGVKGSVRMPFDGTIVSACLLADQVGDIVIDIWNDTYANYQPTDADSITASAPPTLDNVQKSLDTTLTGWTKTFDEGDVLTFNIDSCSTVTSVTLILVLRRTDRL